MTPILRRILRRASPSAEAMSSPSIQTWPAAGRYRPIMCFSIVLLPLPEPPRITKTSPRFTSKETSSKMVRSPYFAVRCSTRMMGSPATSPAQHVEDHGEDALRARDEDDPAHHRAGGRLAHGPRPLSPPDPAQAAHPPHQHPHQDTLS